jgi:asparagine synthase (glutamine-hydrolysing)
MATASASIPPALRAQLWKTGGFDLVAATRSQFDAAFTRHRGEDLLGRLQRHDVANYIAYDNLPKVDITTMYHSLEVRVPLLDHVFLETARQVPPEFKLKSSPHGIIGKYLLKQTAARFFPHDFLHRPKRGFEVPVRDWFGGSFAAELKDRLTGPQSRLMTYFQHDVVSSMIGNAAVDRPAAWRGWTLLVLDEWLRQAERRPDHMTETPIRDFTPSLSSSISAE